MNPYTSVVRVKNAVCSLVFALACLSVNPVFACGEDECGTDYCGCETHKCPTCAGNYCTANNITCDLKGQCGYSCALWCTTFSNTCSNTGGQLGSSECCVTE